MAEHANIDDVRVLKPDRKSTRLNSSHGYISYAVFCLKKKKKKVHDLRHRPYIRGAAVADYMSVTVSTASAHLEASARVVSGVDTAPSAESLATARPHL